jgi:hypothetical protein
MPDFLGMLVEEKAGDIQHEVLVGEIHKRETILNHHYGSGIAKTDRYVLARWLSYSSWVITHEWSKKGTTDPKWWDGFSLREACEFERGRCLVDWLKSKKALGKKPIVVAYAVFHQQFAAQVKFIQSSFADMIGPEIIEL